MICYKRIIVIDQEANCISNGIIIIITLINSDIFINSMEMQQINMKNQQKLIKHPHFKCG